jgi:predicted RNA-binding Zn-ribbon protein involved in translation (DUF1610 family)
VSQDVGDGEPCSVFTESIVRARKAHKCHACGETIRAGDKYSSTFLVWEGTAETIKRCARCQTIHLHLRKVRDPETYPAERLDCGDDYEDVHGEPPPDDIAALAFALPGEVKL